VCTTSMCSDIDHLEWHLDVYWRMCTTSMCSNTDHFEWYLDVYWRCVLRQCAATLITLNDILMSTGGCVLRQCAATLITLNETVISTGGVYYINVQKYWSTWMRPWGLLEVCTTSMCSNIDHLEWHIDVYWRVRTTTMCSNTDHLEWDLDVYWRCVLRQCAATLITLNDILMSNGGVYYINVQQHWSLWMRPWCLLKVCTASMCSNTNHLEWHLDVY
jgi:hypothetical protein